eukprot:9721584-Lingulodinium_polyedra.AAC.1
MAHDHNMYRCNCKSLCGRNTLQRSIGHIAHNGYVLEIGRLCRQQSAQYGQQHLRPPDATSTQRSSYMRMSTDPRIVMRSVAIS